MTAIIALQSRFHELDLRTDHFTRREQQKVENATIAFTKPDRDDMACGAGYPAIDRPNSAS